MSECARGRETWRARRGALLVALALACGAAGPCIAAARKLVDGVAAVVGSEIILESEIDEEIYIYQMRAGAAVPEDEVAGLRGEILREMMEEMLLVAKAKRDSIVLEPGELEDEIERRLDDLRVRQGSEEALQAALAAQGLTLEKLTDLYRDDIERRLLSEKVVREEVRSKIAVTWKEVEDYYAGHTDEVARVPERFEIGGILVSPKVSEAKKKQAVDRLNEARARIVAGEPFEEIAREYSEDPNAQSGGDLGTFGRGAMVPEFEEAAFALAEGELSGIIVTRFGCHIVELLEKKDGLIHARHILIRMVPGPEEDALAAATAESLRVRSLAGEDFSGLARRRSDDPELVESGGVLGWFTAEELPDEIAEPVLSLPVGGLADVVPSDVGYYVIKVLAREPERTADLDEVREQLRDYLIKVKTGEGYRALIDRLSREVYTDVRGETTPVGQVPAVAPPTEAAPGGATSDEPAPHQ